ncbi:mce related family protein, partial [Vibrio cholerae HC-17A1]|jgi:hypothetical protein
LA